MSVENVKEELEGSMRTLGFAYARHLESVKLAANTSSWMDVEEVIKENNISLLSRKEAELSIKAKMVLPAPMKTFGEKNLSIDLFNVKIDDAIKNGKRVYVLTGVFDVFTGGHWQLVQFANLLAHINEYDPKEAVKIAGIHWATTKNNHWEHIFRETRKRRLEQNCDLGGGIVAVRLEPDSYIEEFKGKPPIFPEKYRAGWFEQFGDVDFTTVYPSTQSGSHSWEFGNQLLTGWPNNVDIKNQLVFVLPIISENGEEIDAVTKREEQIRQYGFGVVKVPSQITDTSSSKLIEKFDLEPVRGI